MDPTGEAPAPAPVLKLPRFTDREARTWDIDINVRTISRVRRLLNLNLLELLLQDSKLNERLDDPVQLVDVLYVLCKDQCDAQSVTDEQFGRSLTRDSIEDGWRAVLEGLVSFSPRGVRPAYRKALDKARTFLAAQENQVAAIVETPEFNQAMEQALKKFTTPGQPPTPSSNTAGNLAASSGSTRGHLPSESCD
jgi:hypothetical protein